MITETATAGQMLDAMDDVDSARAEIIIHLPGNIAARFDTAYVYNGGVQVAVWWPNPYNAECPFTLTLRQDTYTISYEG